MWNWTSGKEASSLVSSIHNKSVGAVPQTFLNWVILFLRVLILRYPTTGLFVHNVLKFVSSFMSKLWFVFLTFSLFWLATLSRCFLKPTLKELILFALAWKEVLFGEKLCGDIREVWSHDSNDTFFWRSSSFAYYNFRIPNQIFSKLQNTFTVQM